MISASQLYNYSQCPHRVYLDVHGDPAQRDEPNAFVQMLWDHGNVHEKTIVSALTVADLSGLDDAAREHATIDAMRRGVPLIYAGRITHNGLVGVPDLLEHRGGGYVPGDIKSGSGLEETESGDKLKKQTLQTLILAGEKHHEIPRLRVASYRLLMLQPAAWKRMPKIIPI